MDTAALIAVIIAGLTGASLIITSIVLLIRGAFLLGRVVNHVEVLDQKVDSLEQKVDTLTDAVNDLRVEMVAGQEKAPHRNGHRGDEAARRNDRRRDEAARRNDRHGDEAARRNDRRLRPPR